MAIYESFLQVNMASLLLYTINIHNVTCSKDTCHPSVVFWMFLFQFGGRGACEHVSFNSSQGVNMPEKSQFDIPISGAMVG